MSDFRWVPEAAVKAIQAELIAEHGGEPGVLNAGQLSATLARPQNLFAYGDSPTLFDLAASYGYGLVKNHCFVDGNKRVAVAIVDVFLQLNGYELMAEEPDVVLYFLRLAGSLNSSEEDEKELARWIEENSART
jgi:death on curing protein